MRLYIQVVTMVNPSTPNIQGRTLVASKSAPKSGKCQIIWKTARMRLAKSAFRPFISLGRAKPFQAGSSPKPIKRRMDMNIAGRSERGGMRSHVGASVPSRRFIPMAALVAITGRSKTIAYQPIPTRHCTMRRRKSFTSAPLIKGSTINAANSGPIGKMECASKGHIIHESA